MLFYIFISCRTACKVSYILWTIHLHINYKYIFKHALLSNLAVRILCHIFLSKSASLNENHRCLGDARDIMVSNYPNCYADLFPILHEYDVCKAVCWHHSIYDTQHNQTQLTSQSTHVPVFSTCIPSDLDQLIILSM